MKYLILIHSNPQSRGAWTGFSETERTAGLSVYARLYEELESSGELISSEALGDAAMSKRVTVTDGQATTTDGPFAEVKEELAGFFLVECSDLDRAVEIAARIPEAHFGLVEVRPVVKPGGLEF
jgi:hypothetical protein